MRSDGTGHPSILDLFAKRQVHIRSGLESRYVVLSRPLQIGVAAGALAIVALLAIASYNAIAKHMALVAQQRTVAELTSRMAQAPGSEELAALRERSEAAEHEIERLNAALAHAQAEHAAAVGAGTEAQAALDAATAERERLAVELEQARAVGQGDAAAQSTRQSTRMQELLAEVTGLRAELNRVNLEAETLRRTATQARQALRDLQSEDSPPRAQLGGAGAAPPLRLAIAASPATDEVRRLQQDLAGAQATIATLGTDLETVKGAETSAGAAADAAAALATLKEQLSAANRRVEQLGATLVTQPTETVAGSAPTDPVPLPSPPAPR